MRFFKLEFLLICVLSSQLFIVNCFAEGVGSSAGGTLLQPVSAKAAGVAEAYTSIAGEIVGLPYNSAGIATFKGRELSAMYQNGLADDNFGAVLFGVSSGFGAWGMSVGYYDTGEIDMYDLDANLVSKTGQKDIVAAIGAGLTVKNYEQFSYGASLKLISSEIFGEKATAAAFDAGLQYRDFMPNINVGVAIQNIGSDLKYISKKEKLPAAVRIGSSYSLMAGENRFRASIDLPYMMNEKEILSLLGLEYIFTNLIALRGGYRLNLSDSGRSDEQNIRFGVGFMFKNFAIDYAIGITENLSNPHYISFASKF